MFSNMKFKNIIGLWPSASALAAELSEIRGEKIETQRVYAWGIRHSIPSEYWRDLIRLSDKHGYDITSDLLTQVAAESLPLRPSKKAA